MCCPYGYISCIVYFILNCSAALPDSWWRKRQNFAFGKLWNKIFCRNAGNAISERVPLCSFKIVFSSGDERVPVFKTLYSFSQTAPMNGFYRKTFSSWIRNGNRKIPAPRAVGTERSCVRGCLCLVSDIPDDGRSVKLIVIYSAWPCR